MKLSEQMKQKMLLSFEVVPPKTDKGMENLPNTIDHLCEYNPSYISCTNYIANLYCITVLLFDFRLQSAGL